MIQPVKVKLSADKFLLIEWNDNLHSSFELTMLRRLCPCASCLAGREKQGKNYIPIFGRDQVKVESINPVGNYALVIKWKDGHDTGIYEYQYLYKLAGKNKVMEK
ncbi:MAG: DUF971 domain-containing protein [Ignavibacteriaceae bacterium]